MMPIYPSQQSDRRSRALLEPPRGQDMTASKMHLKYNANAIQIERVFAATLFNYNNFVSDGSANSNLRSEAGLRDGRTKYEQLWRGFCGDILKTQTTVPFPMSNLDVLCVVHESLVSLSQTEEIRSWNCSMTQYIRCQCTNAIEVISHKYLSNIRGAREAQSMRSL